MVRNKKNPVKRPEEISCRSCAFQLELFVAANSWPRDVSCEVNPWSEIKSVFWGFLKTGYPYSQWLIIMFPTEIPFLGVYCAPFSDTPMYPPTPPTARGSASEKTLQSARGKTWWEQPARAREREADKRRKQGARCKKSCKSAIHCRFLPPLSGQPEGYRNYLPRTATCPRNNRQPVKLLQTNRSASWWSINLVPVYIMKSWRFSGVIFEAAMVCMIWFSEDLRIGKPNFAARLCCTLSQTHHYQAVISTWMEFSF